MRNKVIVRVAAILTIFSILTGCTKQPELYRYSADFLELFNTVSRIVGYAKSEEEFKEQSDFIYNRLEFYHQQFDFFKSYDGINNIKTINDNAGKSPVEVDESIIDLLELSIWAYEETDGAVNVAMGSVLNLWHQQREEYQYDAQSAVVPSKEELEEAAKHIDIRNIIIDRSSQTVYLADPEMRLDVGAIAKGYAVQKVSEEAREFGINSMILSIGGNVVTIGTKPGNEKWSVGIQNPDWNSKEDITPSLKLADLSLVSSGDYERYFVADGISYGHIIDPATLMPPTHYKQVSVVASDSGIGDILSTALFILDIEDGKKLLQKHHAEAMWVMRDGSVVYSDSFREYEKE